MSTLNEVNASHDDIVVFWMLGCDASSYITISPLGCPIIVAHVLVVV